MLGIKREILLNEENITKRRNKNEVLQLDVEKKTVFNLPILTPIEQRVLSKGLIYGNKAKKLSTFEIMARFEQLAESQKRIAETSK